MENLMNIINEYEILKIATSEQNKEVYFENSARYKNAIVETKEGQLFAISIKIGDKVNFNSEQNSKYGITRNHISERANIPYNPKNIERITFLIDGQEYEFVACNNGI